MFVCLIGGDLCDELINSPEDSYRAYMSVCDLETSTMRRPRPDLGCCTIKRVISTLISVQSPKYMYKNKNP